MPNTAPGRRGGRQATGQESVDAAHNGGSGLSLPGGAPRSRPAPPPGIEASWPHAWTSPRLTFPAASWGHVHRGASRPFRVCSAVVLGVSEACSQHSEFSPRGRLRDTVWGFLGELCSRAAEQPTPRGPGVPRGPAPGRRINTHTCCPRSGRRMPRRPCAREQVHAACPPTHQTPGRPRERGAPTPPRGRPRAHDAEAPGVGHVCDSSRTSLSPHREGARGGPGLGGDG